MKKFTLEQVRAALIQSDILSEAECAAMSDDELRAARFSEDLRADSLSIIWLFQLLEDKSYLVIPDDEFWDAETVNDILMLECH